MLDGEDQSPPNCEDCGEPLPVQVLKSNAGWYIGTFCNNCGPYSRMSDYFPSREAAESELNLWQNENVRPSGRTPGFQGEKGN